MQFQRSFLVAGEYLPIGWMSSDNGLFYLQMQDDGNLVIYRGSGPSDSHGAVWTSNSNGNQDNYYVGLQPDGNFVIYRGTSPSDSHGFIWATGTNGSGAGFIQVQDDGNLCLYKGTDPSNKGDLVWSSGKTDPVKSIEITNIVYNISNAQTLSTDIAPDVAQQSGQNNTDTDQSYAVTLTGTVTITRDWSFSETISSSIKTSIQAGIPEFAETSIEISTDESTTQTIGGSEEISQTISREVTLQLPPGKSYTATMLAKIAKIKVPYTAYGTVTLQSGTTLPQIQGIYTGTNCFDTDVTFNKS